MPPPDAPPPPIHDQAPPLETPRRLLQYAGEGWRMECLATSARAWFKSVTVANKGVADFWLLVCDGRRDKPTMCPLYVPLGTSQSLDRTHSPRLMASGIYVVASSSAEVVTPIVTPDAWFEIAYETELPPLS